MAFAQARGTSLAHCFFTEVHGDYFRNENGRLDGLNRLCQAASSDAAYNSAERYPPPSCLPGTRRELLEEVHSWLRNPRAPPVMWLYGPAGTGKSAVAQTICESCANYGILLASFFFSTNIDSRTIIHTFVHTLALQLAISLPRRYRKLITDAIELDPSLWKAESRTQMQKLILGPLSAISKASEIGRMPYVMVVDGIDECEDRDQERLLSLLLMLAESQPLQAIGVRIIVSSRPEPRIRHRFHRGDLQRWSIAHPIQASEVDVACYLQHQFDQLDHFEHHASILEHLPKPWPGKEVINLLARLSGGYFVHAVTMFRHITEEGGICVDRLNEIIDPTRTTTHPALFKDIDALYLRILSHCQHDQEIIIRIFAFLILVKHKIPRPILRLTSLSRVIETLLDMRHGEMKMRIRKLYSLLQVIEGADGKDDIQFYHASFQDFLLDKARSGSWHVDPELMSAQFFSMSLRHIFRWDNASQYSSDNSSVFAWARVIELWNHLDVTSDRLVETIREHLCLFSHHSSLLSASKMWPKDVKCDYIQMLENIFARMKSMSWVGVQDVYISLLTVVRATFESFLLDPCDAESRMYLQHLRTMQEVQCSTRNTQVYPQVLLTLGCRNLPKDGMSIFFDARVNQSHVLQSFLEDQEIWGMAHEIQRRHAVLAHACLCLLDANAFHESGGIVFRYASQMWAVHLACSPVGDRDLICALRRVNILAAFAFDHDWASLGFREPANQKAARVFRWLTAGESSIRLFEADNPSRYNTNSLLLLWEKYASEAFWGPSELASAPM